MMYLSVNPLIYLHCPCRVLCACMYYDLLKHVCVPVRTELLSLAGKSIGKVDKNMRMAAPSPLSTPPPAVQSAAQSQLCWALPQGWLSPFAAGGGHAAEVLLPRRGRSGAQSHPGAHLQVPALPEVGGEAGFCLHLSGQHSHSFLSLAPHLRGDWTAGRYNVLSGHIPHMLIPTVYWVSWR